MFVKMEERQGLFSFFEMSSNLDCGVCGRGRSGDWMESSPAPQGQGCAFRMSQLLHFIIIKSICSRSMDLLCIIMVQES
jgi:hypothetical protein